VDTEGLREGLKRLAAVGFIAKQGRQAGMCSRYGRQKRLCADGIGPVCGQDAGSENGAVFADQDVKTVAGGAFIA